jgi:hypothetical protein
VLFLQSLEQRPLACTIQHPGNKKTLWQMRTITHYNGTSKSHQWGTTTEIAIHKWKNSKNFNIKKTNEKRRKKTTRRTLIEILQKSL